MKMFRDDTLEELREHGISFRGPMPPPDIVANHIDGPLLYFSDGQLHWLTLWERWLFWWGLTDSRKLQEKLRPRLVASIKREAIRLVEEALEGAVQRSLRRRAERERNK